MPICDTVRPQIRTGVFFVPQNISRTRRDSTEKSATKCRCMWCKSKNFKQKVDLITSFALVSRSRNPSNKSPKVYLFSAILASVSLELHQSSGKKRPFSGTLAKRTWRVRNDTIGAVNPLLPISCRNESIWAPMYGLVCQTARQPGNFYLRTCWKTLPPGQRCNSDPSASAAFCSGERWLGSRSLASKWNRCPSPQFIESNTDFYVRWWNNRPRFSLFYRKVIFTIVNEQRNLIWRLTCPESSLGPRSFDSISTFSIRKEHSRAWRRRQVSTAKTDLFLDPPTDKS